MIEKLCQLGADRKTLVEFLDEVKKSSNTDIKEEFEKKLIELVKQLRETSPNTREALDQAYISPREENIIKGYSRSKTLDNDKIIIH